MGDSDFDEPPVSQPQKASTATRVDPAHVAVDLVAAEHAGEVRDLAYATVALPAAPASADVVEQVRMQAAQLGGHLQRHQRSLDHREAQLNARLAAVENEIRSARLWLAGRHEALADRMAELAQQERDIDVRHGELAKCHGQLNERERQIDVREAELAERLNALSTAEATSHHARTTEQTKLDAKARELSGLAEKTRQVERAVSELEQRRANLDAGEAVLAEQQAALIAERQRLMHERQAFDEDVRLERQHRAIGQQRMVQELEAQQHVLERRGEQIDARRAALAELRVEIGRAQREALEMRLATEEVWARMQGSAAPATLTQSLAQLRLKLADQNRLALTEIAQQKAELQAFAAKISAQHDALARQRASLERWANERQQEIGEQAATLAQREREIDDDHRRMDELQAHWQAERYGYQQEIRRLLRQLRRGNPMAA